jgi:hypothetical protein
MSAASLMGHGLFIGGAATDPSAFKTADIYDKDGNRDSTSLVLQEIHVS